MTTTTTHARRGDTSTERSSLRPRAHLPLGDGADPPAAPPSRRRTGVAGPLGVGARRPVAQRLVLLPLAALTVTSLGEGLGGFWDAVTAPVALASLRVTVLVVRRRRRRQRRDGHPHRLGPGARRLPRQAHRQRPHRPAVRAADDRGEHRAAVALRPEQPDRHPPQRHPAGPAGRPGLRHPAVRRPLGAARPDRGRPRGRGGRGVAGCRRTGPPSAGSCCRPWRRPSSAAPAWPSPARSASTARWCSSAATSRARPRSPRSTSSSRSRSTGRLNAAAVSVALLAIAFVTLFVLRLFAGRSQRREEDAPVKTSTACPARPARPSPSATSCVLLAVPIVLILWRTFGEGVGAFVDSIRTPAAISALNLSLLIVAIVVPLNVVFGVATALALVRGRFRGRGARAGRGRPAVRGVAHRRRRLADPAVGRRRLVRRPRAARLQGHLRAARHGASPRSS